MAWWQNRTGSGILLGILLCVFPARAQIELQASEPGDKVLLPPTDLAVFESAENRADLDCQVNPIKPTLDFDFRFHTGYDVSIGMQQLADAGDNLLIVMRVTPEGGEQNPHYLEDRVGVPPIDKNMKGKASFTGGFDVGPGRYRVDWLVRNRLEHICSAHWEIEARPDANLTDLPIAMGAGEVAPHQSDPFAGQSRLPGGNGAQGLHVAVLVNFSPAERGASAIEPKTLQAVVSILRGIVRQPEIGRVDLVAFSAQQESVVYRAANVSQIDFPALGEAVKQVPLGTVDYRQLDDRDSEMRFLGKLLAQQLTPEPAEPDAVIVVGPKLDFDCRLPHELPPNAAEARCPIFYLSYNPDPVSNPWRDAIGTVVKAYKGIEYPIAAPRDFERAFKEMMFRVGQHN